MYKGKIMKKVIYTILSICSIIYIAFLSLNIVRSYGWNVNFGWFEKWFKLIVDFGGVAIIFAFALVNFAGSPLKIAFFILLILAIVCYVILLCIPNSFHNFFNKKEIVDGTANFVETFLKI